MKKQFLNLGKALNRVEQKQIFGGVGPVEDWEDDGVGGVVGGSGCPTWKGLYCDCPSGSYGNAEGCGCLDDSWCVMGNCWKGTGGHGMFGMCHA